MGIVWKGNGAALLRITGYAGHAGIPLRLKCTGDGGLACRDEGKNIFLEGSRPIECSLMQRDGRFLVFSSVSPKWFSTFRAEEEPLNLVGNGVEDARIAERFLCEAYIPSGGEGSSRRS